VEVCLDSSVANPEEVKSALLKAIATWNELQITTSNFVRYDPRLPSGVNDFESYALHELGHCIGLGHGNLGAKGCDEFFCFATEYTNSTTGPDGSLDYNPGADSVAGSADDYRGDDVNKFFFRKEDNSPFSISSPVDSTTYSQDIADLPQGHAFAVNGNPGVALHVYELEDTSTAMHATLNARTTRRSLAADDVATLKYGMSGIDELASSTADNYTVNLVFTESSSCDISIKFGILADLAAGAECKGSATLISGNHYVTSNGVITFDSIASWYYSGGPDLTLSATDNGVEVVPGDRITYSMCLSNTGTTATFGEVIVETTVPDYTTFNPSASTPGWFCSEAGACSLVLPSMAPESSPVNIDLAVDVATDVPPVVVEIIFEATASDDGAGGDMNISDNTASETTPVHWDGIFLSNFETGDTSDWSTTVPTIAATIR
jgi:uncharacterized repeat protein (TIGR01451 family)